MKRGLFISLEGGEGSGKTTQIKALQTSLDPGTLFTREPGGTMDAEKIRALLVQRDGGDWSAEAECLLLFAARHMHARDLIRPALAQGRDVVTDRFTDSTRAYQGHGRGLDPSWIENLNRLTLGDFQPDVTFILDIPVETGLHRAGQRLVNDDVKAREDRFERLGIDFHQRMRDGFHAIAAANPARCRIIDAARESAEVTAEILSLIGAARV